MLLYHNSNPKVKHLTVKDLKKYDVIMISCKYSHFGLTNGIIFPLLLTCILDSGLESMHRKELKGWRRGEGIVKEDSKPATQPL